MRFAKIIYKKLKEIEKEFNLHRIQCTVQENHYKSHRWVRLMGFKREGLLERYGPEPIKENWIMYARVRSD